MASPQESTDEPVNSLFTELAARLERAAVSDKTFSEATIKALGDIAAYPLRRRAEEGKPEPTEAMRDILVEFAVRGLRQALPAELEQRFGLSALSQLEQERARIETLIETIYGQFGNAEVVDVDSAADSDSDKLHEELAALTEVGSSPKETFASTAANNIAEGRIGKAQKVIDEWLEALYLEADDTDRWNPHLIIAFMRAAAGKGYNVGVEDEGESIRQTGYIV